MLALQYYCRAFFIDNRLLKNGVI